MSQINAARFYWLSWHKHVHFLDAYIYIPKTKVHNIHDLLFEILMKKEYSNVTGQKTFRQ